MQRHLPYCKGNHHVDGENGCHNEECRGRPFCISSCKGCPCVVRPVIPQDEAAFCSGNHHVDGENGCHNEACRGRAKCIATCTGCPDNEAPHPPTSPAESTAVANCITVMSFNIWENGGRSLPNCISAIQKESPDVVCLQEAMSRTAIAIARKLDMYCAPTLGVLSRFPITTIGREAQSCFLQLHLGSRRHVVIQVCNIHPTAYPYPPHELKDGKQSVEEVLLIHERVQVPYVVAATHSLYTEKFPPEQLSKLTLAQPNLAHDGVLQILAGDFNCPSHVDSVVTWGACAPGQTRPLSWRGSKLLEEHGFLDAAFVGFQNGVGKGEYVTWSPLASEEQKGCFDRIDFVYFRVFGGTKGNHMNVTVGEVEHVDRVSDQIESWPSDHRAVVVRLAIGQPSGAQHTGDRE